jgi:peptidoglycan biosynthesis protein MviN/MurJ (putative lipid II flippase)
VKSIREWLVDDWQDNRFRLIVETAGACCFISVYLIMAWFGDNTPIFVVFLFTLSGALLHSINAYLRKSINLLLLNIIVVCITIFGMAKMLLA